MVRRIAAMLLMEPALDANYLATKSGVYEWPQPELQVPKEELVEVEDESE